MTAPDAMNVSAFLKTLRSFPLRWILPALLIGGGACLYAVHAPPVWEASQALMVRNEVTGTPDGLGKFGSIDAMKTVQETILELLKSRRVLEDAMVQAGVSPQPSAEQIDNLRDDIKLVPPKGAEFGRTEVFYLKVRQHQPERAMAVTAALCAQLQRRFQDLRDAKAQSMIDELTKTVHVAQTDLEQSNRQLNALETQVGSDLAELRRLGESGYGDSALQRTLGEIGAELRQARNNKAADDQLLALLQKAAAEPQELLAAPNRLLESQPALRKLKEGLIEAQLRTAQLRGRMSAEHPLVQASRDAERQVADDLHREAAQAAAGLQVDAQLSANRVTMLEAQQSKVAGELAHLGGLRAGYANLLSETRNREIVLQKAEQNLGEARAAQASARAASLLTTLGAPDVGSGPVNPPAAAVALAGILGGLVVGVGGVFLTVPTVPRRSPFAEVLSKAALFAASDRLSLKRSRQKVAGAEEPRART